MDVGEEEETSVAGKGLINEFSVGPQPAGTQGGTVVSHMAGSKASPILSW